ncbi:MAG TPA: hypothetical protein VN300_05785 [Desulfobacterales bacterium]|nr:hypothetical protein [Desulfobacterales bacterium]
MEAIKGIPDDVFQAGAINKGRFGGGGDRKTFRDRLGNRVLYDGQVGRLRTNRGNRLGYQPLQRNRERYLQSFEFRFYALDSFGENRIG